MSQIIVDNTVFNSDPKLNKLAKAIFSIGEKKVGDKVYYFSTEYIVVKTNVTVFEESGKHRHGIIAQNAQTGYEVVLTNSKEKSDFSSIWSQSKAKKNSIAEMQSILFQLSSSFFVFREKAQKKRKISFAEV